VPKDPTAQRTAYLPPRAGKARKLILRTQLGLPWILAAIAFGLVILVAGSLFLLKGGRPGAPWQRVAPVTRFADGAVTQAPLRPGEVVVVDRRGTLRAFLAPAGRCPVVGTPNGFARPCVLQAWDQEGRPIRVPSSGPTGAPPLRALPATVAKGDLYVNPRAA
jgi:nitrite reductase/ring-hydroxylating ferredoxin subunit